MHLTLQPWVKPATTCFDDKRDDTIVNVSISIFMSRTLLATFQFLHDSPIL